MLSDCPLHIYKPRILGHHRLDPPHFLKLPNLWVVSWPAFQLIKSQIYTDTIRFFYHFFIFNNLFETVKFNWSSIQTSCLPCWLCIFVSDAFDVDLLVSDVSDVSENPKKNHHPSSSSSTGGYKHINHVCWFYTHKVPTFHGILSILHFCSWPGRSFLLPPGPD